MKVLIVYPRMYLYGGAELLIVRLANHLTRVKIRNALLTEMILPEIERDLLDTQIITCPVSASENDTQPLSPLRTLWFLYGGVRKHGKRFDLINVHNYPAELLAFGQNKPVVWMCNEPPEVAVNVRVQDLPACNPKRLLFDALLCFDRYVVRRHIRSVVVADSFNEARFRRIYGFTPHIINYGIDCDYFATPVKTAAKKAKGSFTMLHVGMQTPMKNQMESVLTLERLQNRIPGIRLILAGQGQPRYLGLLKRVIHEKGLEGRVQFTGHVDREQIRRLYHTCDVLLHPIKAQGGWLSPFEAVSAGLPVVVSREMTAADIIKEEDLGLVTDDFAAGVADVYLNRGKYVKAAVGRAEWVRDHLSWDIFSEKMLSIFKDVSLEKGVKG